MNLYNKKQFHINYKIDEHIIKKTYPKNVISTNPTKKKKDIYYNQFKTSNLIISNSSSPPPLNFLIGQTSYTCSNVP